MRVLLVRVAEHHVERNNPDSVPDAIAAIREVRHFIRGKDTAGSNSRFLAIHELPFHEKRLSACHLLENAFHIGEASGVRRHRHVADDLRQGFRQANVGMGMMDFYTLPDEEDAIDEILPDVDVDIASAREIREVQYFNLSGQRIYDFQPTMVNGQSSMFNAHIIIRKEIYEDGSFSSKKIMIGGSK